MYHANITRIYQTSFLLTFGSAILMFSSNLEQMSKICRIETKAEIHSGVVSTAKDGIKDLPKIIQSVGKTKQKLPVKTAVPAGKTTGVEISQKSQSTSVVSVQKKIYRNGWNDPRVQYGYDISKGNMDFILTIEAESRWDMNAVGDHGNSFGLCQIHKRYNAKMQKQYRDLKTDNEKIKMCYDQYQDWVKRGVIKTRLYGYNYRKARAYLFEIKSL